MTAPLTETVWTPGRHSTLDAAALTPDQQAGDAYTPDRMWAAYFQSASPQIVLSAGFSDGDEAFPPLRAYIERHQPSTLLDCLFVVDTYYQSRILRAPLPGPEPGPFASDPLLDELLAPSRGLLLWQFQFEHLAQLAGLARPEAITLRRYVNQKRPIAFKRMVAMRLPSGSIFADVVTERLRYDGTIPGQWKAAQRLLHASSRGSNTGH